MISVCVVSSLHTTNQQFWSRHSHGKWGSISGRGQGRASNVLKSRKRVQQRGSSAAKNVGNDTVVGIQERLLTHASRSPADTFAHHGALASTTAPHRLPLTVVRRHRKKATIIWVSLIIAFVACECWDISTCVAKKRCSRMLFAAFQGIAQQDRQSPPGILMSWGERRCPG